MSVKIYNNKNDHIMKNISNVNNKIGERRKSKQVKFRNSMLKNKLSSHNSTGLIDSELEINRKSMKLRQSSQLGSTSFSLKLIDPVFSILEDAEEILIRQEADILEAVSGCQKPNNYHVYGRLANKHLVYIFKCREFSGCCMRCFCPVNIREFDMKIKHMNKDKNNKNDFNKDLYLNIYKPLRCACICICRPELDIKYSDSNKKNNNLGKIRSLFSILDPKFEVENKEGKILYNIVADCCQCGLMCRNNMLGKTDEAHFFIYNPIDFNSPIGDICKKSSESLLSISDDYIITLPKNSEPEEKLLLISAGLMIDYQYFERNGNTAPKY